jgi:hypothetical protein
MTSVRLCNNWCSRQKVKKKRIILISFKFCIIPLFHIKRITETDRHQTKDRLTFQGAKKQSLHIRTPQDSRAGSALATATDGCTTSATNSGPHQPPHLTLVTTLAMCSPSRYPSLPASIESTSHRCSSGQSSIALPRRICGGRYRCCTGGSGTAVRGSREVG